MCCNAGRLANVGDGAGKLLTGVALPGQFDALTAAGKGPGITDNVRLCAGIVGPIADAYIFATGPIVLE